MILDISDILSAVLFCVLEVFIAYLMVLYGNLDDEEELLFARILNNQLLDADPELNEEDAAYEALHFVMDILGARMSQTIIAPLIQSHEMLPPFHRTMSDYSDES